jgi:hypothetical protein
MESGTVHALKEQEMRQSIVVLQQKLVELADSCVADKD